MMGRILVIGANGQIGSELVDALADLHGDARVIAADLAPPRQASRVRFATLDVLDALCLRAVVNRYDIDEIYMLAAVLSASGEATPVRAWTLNMNGAAERARTGTRKANLARILAVVDCRVRTAQPACGYPATRGDGSNDDLWNQQAGRRAPLRVLPRPIWR